MDNIIKGDLILRDIAGTEARATLVNTLLRIYRSATPVQLEAMIARPKPLVLIQGIEETKATKLIEILQPHGVVLEFLTSVEEDWQLEAIPAAPGSDRQETQTHVQPAAPPVPPASVASDMAVKPEIHSPIAVPAGRTFQAKRGKKVRKEKRPGSGKPSSARTAFRTLRIAVLLLFLLGAIGVALQVRNQTMTPGHIFSVAQDKLHTWGFFTSTPAIEVDTDSDLLNVLYEPPSSVMSVDPEDMVAAYQELYAPRPDRRFLMAFDTLTKRWAYISGENPQKYRTRTKEKSRDRISIEIMRGRKVVHRVSLPLPTSFSNLMTALDQSLTVLNSSGPALKPAA